MENSPSFFSRRARLVPYLVAALLLLGFAVRMIDLRDAPFDFNPSRQLRGLIIARGLYYQLSPSSDPDIQQTVVVLGESIVDYEPRIFEGWIALTYKLAGGEVPWIPRAYSILFWTIGGAVLFALARRMVSAEGAFVALGFYLFLPFGIYASRSFQPEPLMVMLLICAAYSAWRWSEEPTWKWAILTGFFAGWTVLEKVLVVFMVLGLLVAVFLHRPGLRAALKDRQVWVIVALTSLPSLIYYLIVLDAQSSQSYLSTYFLSLAPLLFSPEFYVRWLLRLEDLIPLTLIFLGLMTFLAARPLPRSMLLGLWVGYFIYGLTVPHQTITHDYYHLQLVPVVALSLAPIGDWLFNRITEQGKFWQSAFILVLLVSIFYPVWIARSTLLGVSYADQPTYWQTVGEALPVNGKVIALTSLYGQPLAYYGVRRVALWPTTAEQELAELRGRPPQEVQAFFANKVEGRDFFLITAFGQLDDQPELKAILYDNYPIYAQGDSYIIFDLRNP